MAASTVFLSECWAEVRSWDMGMPPYLSEKQGANQMHYFSSLMENLGQHLNFRASIFYILGLSYQKREIWVWLSVLS